MVTDLKWTAFRGERCLVNGTPQDVVANLKALADSGEADAILVFDDATGRPVDLDLRGSLDDCLTRLPSREPDPETAAADRRPGRPKLGVVPREVTLLPRHWEWLGEQSGGASVALRKLVETARLASAPADRKRRACEAADRFMRAMAGDRPGYEEAARALYGGHRSTFEGLTKAWPPDIRRHVHRLAQHAFESATQSA
jgi:hypothetical protein